MVERPIQMTVGLSDGERLWAIRYSSEHRSRTLFVSEPPGDLPGAWLAIPEATALIIQPGADEQQPFNPHSP